MTMPRNAKTLSLALAAALLLAGHCAAVESPPATAPVRAVGGGSAYRAEGLVEAVRQASIAAEVSGAVTALPVRAGDSVRQGQVLIQIDGRAAQQQAQANSAQAQAADAELVAARKEFERSERLFQKKYISQAAMEQAQAQFDAAQAQARAHLAQAGAAATQADLHVLHAPYAGLLSSVDVKLGDMAAPGRPLMTLFDPGEMRVVLNVPETVARDIQRNGSVHLEIPAAGGAASDLPARALVVLPAADPLSHTVEVRLTLARGASAARVAPGMFARADLPTATSADSADSAPRLLVPAQSVVRRTELAAVYVIDSAGKASLRQVRVGARVGSDVEILAGVHEGERVAMDPVAAARH